MRAVVVVLWGMCVAGCATSDARWRAEQQLRQQVYEAPCAAIRQTVLERLADEQIVQDTGAIIETGWRYWDGQTTYKYRIFVQFVETDAPSCRIMTRLATRDTRRDADEVKRAYGLEREVMRVHDPEAYEMLPVVEFW